MRKIIVTILVVMLAVPAFASSDPSTEEQKALYAIGVSIGRQLEFFAFTSDELDYVQQGIADKASGKKVIAEPENYGRQITELAQTRMKASAEKARELNIQHFSTTLLASPHQKHELIIEVANEIAREKGVAFLYADLRKRYSDSRHITKPLGLYRQQYCGCVYSRDERS